MKIARLDAIGSGFGPAEWGMIVVKESGGDLYCNRKSLFLRDHYDSSYQQLLPKDDSDAVELLNLYDLIIISELHTTMDRKIPRYIKLLNATTTPWTLMLHGLYYHKSGYIDQLFSSKNYLPVGITTHRSVADRFELQHRIKLNDWIVLPLPYRLRAMKQVGTRTGPIVMTSRVESKKGQELLMNIVDKIDHDVYFPGATEQHPGGAYSALLYDKLMITGYHPEVPIRRCSCQPWTMISPHGNTIKFDNGYCRDDLEQILSASSVHVNLTKASMCYGHWEYCSLEAMDYGLPIIVPQNLLMNELDFTYENIFTIVDHYTHRGYPYQQLIDCIRRTLNLTDEERQTIATSYKKQLIAHHDPQTYVRTILERLQNECR